MQNSGHRGHHGHGHPQQSLLVELFLVIAPVATITCTSPGLTAHALSNTALVAEKEHRATWCC